MGRPRAFDEDAALEAAMRVFWEKSYEGATIADLTKAMGINRSSAYAAFGDKEALFRRALDRYCEGPMAYVQRALELPTFRETVVSLLQGTVEFLATPGNPRGCLMIQGALACSTDAEPVKQLMIKRRKEGETALQIRTRRAQREGELDSEIDPTDFARYLKTLITGMCIQAANGETRAEMLRNAEVALRFMHY